MQNLFVTSPSSLVREAQVPREWVTDAPVRTICICYSTLVVAVGNLGLAVRMGLVPDKVMRERIWIGQRGNLNLKEMR